VTRRIVSLIAVVWLLGLAWFAIFLPGPSAVARTDAIVVLTGGPGRFKRGLAVLAAGRAQRLLVSGVDRSVKRVEFDVAQRVPPQLSACCIDLGKDAVDTVSNAQEAAAWMHRHKFKSVRLITTDWHMRRARFELGRAMGRDTVIVSDAVPSQPNLLTLFVEYNKLLARLVSVAFGG
jgi:uncharacterized SAM-binding protein YcdF (DUF218 family)